MARVKNTKTAKTSKKPVSAMARSSKVKAVISVKKSAKAKPVLLAEKRKTAAGTPEKITRNLSDSEVKVKSNAKQKTKLTPREERIQQIKLNLLKQKEILLSEAESALNELPGQTIFPDLGDQASAETDRNFMLRLRGREQRLLKKIDEAVDRIDNGTFGICDDCGNEIDVKRLEARPVTTMCIECKTLQEEEERLREGAQ